MHNVSTYFTEGFRSLTYLPSSLSKSSDLQDKLRKVVLQFLPCNESVVGLLKSANGLYAATALPVDLRGTITDLRNPQNGLFKKINSLAVLGASTIDFVTGIANLELISVVSIAKKIGSLSIFQNKVGANPTFKEITDKLTLTKNVLVCGLTLNNLVQKYSWSLNNKPIIKETEKQNLFDRVADVTRVVFLGLLILSATTTSQPDAKVFSFGKRVLTLKTVTDGACYLSTGAAFFKALYKLKP